MLSLLRNFLSNTYLHPRYLAHRELRRIISLEGSELEGNLLDVGCGRNQYITFLPNIKQYYGIDVPTSIHSSSRIDILGTIMSLPFSTATFDSILCTEVLEHVVNPQMALESIASVMKAGGKLLLTTPFSEQLHEEPFDYHRFTHYALRNLLERTGFRVIRMHRRGGAWLEFGYRLSSFLYSTVGAHRSESGSLKPRLLIAPIIVVLCACIQIMASVLDNIWPSTLSTIGYGVIAERVRESNNANT